MQVVTGHPIKNNLFFRIPLAKEPEDSVYKIGLQLKMLNAAVFASKSESYSSLLVNFKQLNLAFKNVVLKLSTEHRWCIKN